ncbi:hypothetical protein PDJAM_G00203950 [Pangasius djambal]|uniref:Uncharacterized protein n=1 Tax=Pangasius djambal TaxID=1691987 RepID=A0ACC5Y8E9_9TELE|nr:hypothetical protein [Pangasius djambal]
MGILTTGSVQKHKCVTVWLIRALKRRRELVDSFKQQTQLSCILLTSLTVNSGTPENILQRSIQRNFRE